MKFGLLIQLFIIFQLFLIANSIDESTLSNYQDLTVTNLTGIFEPDFTNKVMKGNLNYTLSTKIKGSKIIFDTNNLQIFSVLDIDNEKELKFNLGEKTYLGVPLNIEYEYEPEQTIHININYTTTVNASSALFLNKEQTIGKKLPFLLTISEMTLGRELLPNQDTPAVKFPFYLGIKVENPIRGMISGLLDREEINEEDNTTIYFYNQKIPVPNYLIALAAGNIEGKEIDENISVYSEPEILNKSHAELEEMPTILKLAINNNGEYEWGKYNLLILPASFPYSAMENPCLTFASSCLINGDKSLFDIFVHELIHSWSGNLVTNDNWRDFWLNEGITKFLQRKVVAEWKGADYAKMDAILGLYHIEEALDYLGRDSNYTSLRPNLTGIVPDDIYSDIPYEKGFNFMYYIETLVGEKIMLNFFRQYFIKHKYKSVDLFVFKEDLINYFKENEVDDEALNKIDWNAWIYGAGPCPVENDFSNSYLTQVNAALKKFINEEIDEELEKTFNSWMHTSKTIFFLNLEKRDILLTEKQHDFLTKTLKLYTGQNFLVTTYYFRLILGLTDKFYENEKEYLIQYLSDFGVTDFMYGIYELFYKRDEIAAVETLEKQRDFYHNLMIKKAEKEFKSAKENFPILTIDFVEDNQCSFLSEETKIKINSQEYKDFLENVNITNGIYLESNGSKVELECYLNTSDKYCIIKEKISKAGLYNINVPERVQKRKFAVKVQNGVFKFKTYEKEIKVNETQENKFEFDYGTNEIEKITISFEQKPDENVKIVNNGKEIKCELKEMAMECEINNSVLSIDESKPKDFKEYILKVVDVCGQEKFSFNVKVKNSKKEPITPPNNENNENNKNNDGGPNTVLIIVLSVVCILIFFVIIFFVIKAIRKKSNSNNIETKEEGSDAKLMNDQ